MHPFAAQWVWNKNGWLSSVGLSDDHPGIFGSNGFLDFAGQFILVVVSNKYKFVCA